MKVKNEEKVGEWAKVNVIKIFNYINIRAQITPAVLIDPPIVIGKHNLKVIYIRSWDDIKELNIFPGGTLEYRRYGGSYELRASETSASAIQKTDSVIPTVCPMCGCKELKHSRTVIHCENEECDHYNVKAIWLFIKLCMGIDNITYSKVYKLWELNLLKDIQDLWILNDAALEELDLTKESIATFKDILRNTTEVALEKLIYCLGVPGIKAAYALEIARRIGNAIWYYPINDDKLNDYLKSDKRVNANEETIKHMDAVEPVIIWNKYVDKHRTYLSKLDRCFKLIRPAARLNCAGITINIGKTGPKFIKYILSDLIKLKDGYIIDSVNRAVTYHITTNPKKILASDSELSRELTEIQTPILDATDFCTKFDIQYPSVSLSFKDGDALTSDDL
jgi:DNA ligase (NAD+)